MQCLQHGIEPVATERKSLPQLYRGSAMIQTDKDNGHDTPPLLWNPTMGAMTSMGLQEQ
jgi:hypothetical protein